MPVVFCDFFCRFFIYFCVPADIRTSRFISVFFVVWCFNLRESPSVHGQVYQRVSTHCLQSHSQHNCLSVTLSSACRPLELCAPRELGEKKEGRWWYSLVSQFPICWSLENTLLVCRFKSEWLSSGVEEVSNFKLLLTWFDLVRPFETFWDLVKPCKTFEDYFLEFLL